MLEIIGPGIGLAKSALTALVKRRAKFLHEGILEELAQAKIPEWQAASEDDRLEIVISCSRAIRDGRARFNLRLLAKLLAGLAQLGPIYADAFAKFADVLASMRREQVILLAALVRHRQLVGAMPLEDLNKLIREFNQGSSISVEIGAPRIPSPNHVWYSAQRELVPNVFPTGEHMLAVGWSLTQTGFVMSPLLSDSAGLVELSPLADELRELVDLDDALRKEGPVSQ
jgi:hypothetical protein